MRLARCETCSARMRSCSGLLGLLVCESLPLFRTPRAGRGLVPQLAGFVPLALDPSLVRPPGGQEQDDDHDDGNCDDDPTHVSMTSLPC